MARKGGAMLDLPTACRFAVLEVSDDSEDEEKATTTTEKKNGRTATKADNSSASSKKKKQKKRRNKSKNTQVRMRNVFFILLFKCIVLKMKNATN